MERGLFPWTHCKDVVRLTIVEAVPSNENKEEPNQNNEF